MGSAGGTTSRRSSQLPVPPCGENRRKGLPIQPTIWIITILRIMSTRNNRRPSPQGAETHQVASTTQFVFSTSKNLTDRAQLQFVTLLCATPGVCWIRAALPFYRRAGLQSLVFFPKPPGSARRPRFTGEALDDAGFLSGAVQIHEQHGESEF